MMVGLGNVPASGSAAASERSGSQVCNSALQNSECPSKTEGEKAMEILELKKTFVAVGERVFHAADAHRVIAAHMAKEGSERRLTDREADMLEFSAAQLSRLVEELAALWREEPIGKLALP